MTTVDDRADPMEFDLQPAGSTHVFYYAPVLLRMDSIARGVFAVGTPYSLLGRVAPGPRQHVTDRPGVRPLPATEERRTELPFLGAIEDLRNWLHVSYDDLAKILGWQSASNIHYWRRCARDSEQPRPRASSIEPILRLHALLAAVTETISGGGDPTAMQLWLRTPLGDDVPTPLELLEQGRMDDVERHAGRLLFAQSSAGVPAWQLARLDSDDDDTLGAGSPVEYSAEDFG